jgi:uncharacterized protein YdeI (YjbR/CyaY-like superfamily)
MNQGEYKDLEVWQFYNLDQWLDWLKHNHDKNDKGIWVKIAKKNSGVTTASYADLREGALCYGWIDGLVNALDEKFYMQRMTPRRPKSVWSKINVELCEQYIADGRMQLSGLAHVNSAKKDGRWDRAY